MKMIAFITMKSSCVPLIEGLCAQIYFRFEISVVLLTSSSFIFCEKKQSVERKQYIRIYVYIYVHVCIYVYIYVHIHVWV